ncbi:MAG: hypothetical protein ACLUSP_01965 [Christensenellales bacterium]
MLDSINDRDGQWHYYQSIVYYKREWLTESKRQLEEAIACDPVTKNTVARSKSSRSLWATPIPIRAKWAETR